MKLLLLLALGACSPHHQLAREARQEHRVVRRESGRLADSADIYWRAMRWEDEGRVVAFIEDPEARTAWIVDAPTVRRQTRFRSAEVIQVNVGPAPTGPGDQREGLVIIQAEIYSDDDPVMRTSTRQQRWYRGPGGWFVEPGDELGSEK